MAYTVQSLCEHGEVLVDDHPGQHYRGTLFTLRCRACPETFPHIRASEEERIQSWVRRHRDPVLTIEVGRWEVCPH